MKHLGLFEGIGGFSLAAQWIGWQTIAWVEKDAFCQKILKKNFPKAKGYGDIYEFSGKKYKNKIDIITGGFPCQPFSLAGKRMGEKDDRYLWDEMFRVIREIQPHTVIAENVLGLVSMENGKTLEKIYIDLESEGYSVQSFIIPAAAVGAWHRRNRIWIIAYSDQKRLSKRNSVNKKKRKISNFQKRIQNNWKTHRLGKHASQSFKNSYMPRRKKLHILPLSKEKRIFDRSNDERKTNSNAIGFGFKKQRIHRRSLLQKKNKTGQKYRFEFDGGWEFEPGVGRVAHGIPNRVDRIAALGNAIVPQVAFEIFKIINNFYHQNTQS